MTDVTIEPLLPSLRQIANAGEQALPESVEFEQLIATIYKANRKRRRRRSGQARKAQDRETKRAAGRVRSDDQNAPVQNRELVGRANRCYVCSQPYRQLHSFYHMLCPKCGDRCWPKREQSSDLSGRRALVTGGRIKIGFESALKLLRAGAEVHVTTRFPQDAAVRFSEQADFGQWSDRLTIHRVDFRNLPGLFEFIDDFRTQVGSLNILINNAAQSVKRSQEYHQRLASFEHAKLTSEQTELLGATVKPTNAARIASQSGVQTNLTVNQWLAEVAPLHLLRDDDDRHDQREQNSWTQRLSDIQPVELLEVLLINSAAPALMVRGFRDLFCQSPFSDRFIVNVSGADGTFRLSKSGLHPHVNMSKAAMNMITRSCSRDFATDGICINSVDTGWITHEGSYSYRKLRSEQGFVPPFDTIDGAARVLDPVFRFAGSDPVNITSGALFRNFEPSSW